MTLDWLTLDPQIAQWMAWDLGQDRCPYCQGMCPAEWAAMCDCWMAPASDEWCESCRREHDQIDRTFGRRGGDL